MSYPCKTSTAPTLIRGQTLRRFCATAAGGDDTPLTLAVFGALGRPRQWDDALSRAVGAFTACDPNDTLVNHARAAQHALSAWAGALVDRDKPDIYLVAMQISGPKEAPATQVLSAGSGRVYRYRNGEPLRLSPRRETKEGLLVQRPSLIETSLEPGDVVLVGSVSAFSVRAMAQIAATLHETPDSPVTTLAPLLTGPAERNGTGAAAIALRLLTHEA